LLGLFVTVVNSASC